MSGILKSNVSTYEFSLDQMKVLIAKDLEVSEQMIDVEYVKREVGADPMDRFPGHLEVVSIRVTVKHQISESKS